MESQSNQPPLIVILGQTASGKSALAMELAQRFDGELIAADSRTVYKGMDIGTAKPSTEDRRAAPHHLIDVTTPDKRFSTADFKRLASQAIKDIASRGKLPIMVGGTGLYIDAVIYDFSLRGGFDSNKRRTLEGLSVAELQAMIQEAGLDLPVNSRNPRHLLRALESSGQEAGRSQLRPNTLLIGLDIDKPSLTARIVARAQAMIDQGLVDEVRRLTKQYPGAHPALDTPGYKEFRAYLAGEVDLEEAKRRFVQAHLQYSKRQKTWFKRNKDIRWISKPEEAVELVTTFLNKRYTGR